MTDTVKTALNKAVFTIELIRNIDTAEISTGMMLKLYSRFVQEESMSISRNCRMGVRKRMMDGTYKSASVPFGLTTTMGRYKFIPKKQ